MEAGAPTPPRDNISPSQLHISKLKGSYCYAIGITSLLMALSIPVWVHIREQLTGQSKPPLDTNSPQAIALSITAYVAVLSNGTAAITSYFLLERLNSSEMNDGTAVTPSTDVAQSSPLDSPSQNRLQDPDYVEEEGLCNSGRIQEILGNIKAMTLATVCSTGENLRRWYRRYHQSFAEAYWLLNLFIGLLSPFIEFSLYASIFEVRLVLRIVVVVYSVIAIISLMSFRRITLRTGHV